MMNFVLQQLWWKVFKDYFLAMNTGLLPLVAQGSNSHPVFLVKQKEWYNNEDYPSSRLSNSRVALSVSISHRTSPTAICHIKKIRIANDVNRGIHSWKMDFHFRPWSLDHTEINQQYRLPYPLRFSSIWQYYLDSVEKQK